MPSRTSSPQPGGLSYNASRTATSAATAQGATGLIYFSLFRCKGESWHGLPWVNSCALFEWLTLSLLGASLLAGQADIELYAQLKEGYELQVVESKPRCWSFPPSCVRRCWLALLLWPPLSFFAAYVAWVSSGCSMLPPLLSHLALNQHARWICRIGLVLGDALLLIWFIHLFSCQPKHADLLSLGFQVAGAAFMICGFLGVLAPWDSHLAVHLLSMACILVGETM